MQKVIIRFFLEKGSSAHVTTNECELNMDGLFDVFDEQPQGNSERVPLPPPRANRKRLANGHAKVVPTDATVDDVEDFEMGNGSPSMKRQKRDEDQEMSDPPAEPASDRSPSSPAKPERKRRDQAEAVVADTFETEQSREVVASAGLQGKQEDANLVLSHQVRHQVSLPPDYKYIPLSEHKPPAEPVRTWPFTLDPFQQVSITSIERNESILVSAHTSAGKTVVAEYAIAQCLKNNQRVIYTSPIKALSNQKYREFMADFGDVGLMTGDVTINPTATCLVMTTEILRSMLYRGSEIMREVAWVVFDEVHYLRDKARGVVWEETIILLPDKVRYVFLSATIPNAMQFAEWITKIHRQPCHVVYTDFRPTPLQHYLFPAGADGIHLVVDERGVFREDNFSRAMTTIADKQGDNPADPMAKRKGKGKDKKFNKGGTKGPSDIYKIVKMIMQKSYNPVIVFSFSKNQCESYALQMSQLAFNDDAEKELVSKVFNGAIDMLSETDKQLPQINNLLPLLRRGIGIHHSGLLPILKETIEILFQEGLIKVLFATETFSIGLNMPAKTVVFTSVRKFDGKDNRWVTASEFIQMSGRAGRRGLDERGIVIMMIDEKIEPDVAKEIVRGEQDNLNSAFHLGYNMILNLMRVEGFSPEFMLESCFFQFQNVSSVSGVEKELQEAEAEKASIIVDDEPVVKEYYDLRHQIDTYEKDMKEAINHPNYCLPYMQDGRLIRVRYQEHDFDWAVVLREERRSMQKSRQAELKPQQMHIIHAYMCVADGPAKGATKNSKLPSGVRPPVEGEKSKMIKVPLLMSCIDGISRLRLKMPADESESALASIQRSVQEVKKRFPDGIPHLDPIEDMNIKDESFRKLVKVSALDSFERSPLTKCCRKSKRWTASCTRILCTSRIASQIYTNVTSARRCVKTKSRA